MLNTQSSAPLYCQVENWILNRLEGALAPGDLLPTQREIAAATGTSLITVKRAIGELERRGLLQSRRGRGAIVSRPAMADDHRGVSSWTENVLGSGRSPRTSWMRLTTRHPPRAAVAFLELKAREKAVLLERLRTVDGEPFCLMSNELPARLAPDLVRSGFSEESFYAYLESYLGLRPATAHEEVAARPASRRERELLGHDTKWVLVVTRHSRQEDGSPLEISELIAPAHRYRYRVEIEQLRHGSEAAGLR